ncbi:hypothetical protein Ddye_029337 [Dipteronia dyeriana]|uniref:Phytocyanin domain-containing protein n=1 Tax=Dipteronia dyeriana TaxID=168575 RepID=A0AAD9WLM0_9ROSI|nr:hypothetical protein Ddye_029337 [Dipteronia dyeriana]
MSISMALQRNSCVIFLSFFVAATYCLDGSKGVEYRVGDSVWSIPPYPHFYSDWSSAHLFYMADSLVFDFETELSNLIEVAALDYQKCSANNPIKILISGPATILLKEAGVFYFLCNLSNYCDLGQRISIIVHDPPHANSPPSPSPSPLPTILSPTPVPCSLPLPPTATSPAGFESPPAPMPATSDQAPSPTTDLGHTIGSSNGCSGHQFSTAFVVYIAGISSTFWILFW